MTWKSSTYSGWGRVLKATGDIARPERQSSLEACLTDGLLPACGMRRSYGDAALNNAGRLIDMTRLDRLLDFDAETGILEVEAGALIGEIAAIFAPRSPSSSWTVKAARRSTFSGAFLTSWMRL